MKFVQKTQQNFKSFFYIFYKSATSLDYYHHVLAGNLRLSIKYFLGIVTFFSIAAGIITAQQVTPTVNSYINQALESAKDLFPENLVIKIENGEMSLTTPEPIIIDVPDYLRGDAFVKGQNLEKLVVLDTNGTIDDMKTYKTFVLVNQKNVLALSQTGQVNTTPLSNFKNTVIDKKTFGENVNELSSLSMFVPFVIFFAGFLSFFVFSLLARSISIVTAALFVFGIALLVKFKMILGTTPADFSTGFKNSLKLALHLSTFLFFIDLIILAFNIVIPIPMWYVILLVLLEIGVILALNKGPSQV